MNTFKKGDVVRAKADVGPESNPGNFKLYEGEVSCVEASEGFEGASVRLYGKRGTWSSEHFDLLQSGPDTARVERLEYDLRRATEREVKLEKEMATVRALVDAWRTIANAGERP